MVSSDDPGPAIDLSDQSPSSPIARDRVDKVFMRVDGPLSIWLHR
jgi:hypothetical protein